jgi:3-methyladenine DNA glycosylase/8-oxoguanine DNA glycosylase
VPAGREPADVLEVRRPFNLWATARSHGWSSLAPYTWDEAAGTLARIDRLPNGRVYRLQLADGPATSGRMASVRLSVHPTPPAGDLTTLQLRARRVLRLDEDLGAFHRLCRADPALRDIPRLGAGRMLRSPDVWEDVVKGICTTNVTWRRTIAMVRALTGLGTALDGESDARAFPTPTQVLEAGSVYLTKSAGMGYRARYLLELAESVAVEQRELEELPRRHRTGPELRGALQALPGIGPVTAAYVAMLLGSYDALPMDSSTLGFARRQYFGGRDVNGAAVTRRFQHHGPWKALAFWFEFWLTWDVVRDRRAEPA